MALERTLSIIKPDAVEKHKAGAILGRLEQEGFMVKAMKRIHLTRAEVEGFYAEHKGRGFFDELCAFMSRSPIIVMALEREDAVARYREMIASKRVGPRGLARAVPEVQEGCAPLRASLATLERALEVELAADPEGL